MGSPFLFVIQNFFVFLFALLKATRAVDVEGSFYIGNVSNRMKYEIYHIAGLQMNDYLAATNFFVGPGAMVNVSIFPRQIKPDNLKNYIFCLRPLYTHQPDRPKKG